MCLTLGTPSLEGGNISVIFLRPAAASGKKKQRKFSWLDYLRNLFIMFGHLHLQISHHRFGFMGLNSYLLIPTVPLKIRQRSVPTV